MAKLAVLFFAALAFHAALAGVRRNHHHHDQEKDTEYSYGGQLEVLVGQIQSVTRDVSVTLEDVLPNRQVLKTLTWQSHELAQTIEEIINKLKVQASEYNGSILEQVINALREIKASLMQTGELTDASNVNEIKNQLNTQVQSAAEQLERLARLVSIQTNYEQTQGGLQVSIKGMLNEFLTSVQNIQTQLQNVGIQGQQTPKELIVQIKSTTNGLVESLKGTYLNTQQMRLALREYVQNVEALISKLQKKQGTIGDLQIDNVMQQIIVRLREVLVPVMQITEAGVVENLDISKTQLIREFEGIAEELKQLAQYGQTETQQTLVRDVLFDYLNAIQQTKMQMHGEYQGKVLSGIESKYEHGQGDLLGKDLLMGKLNKYEKPGKGLQPQIQAVVSELAQTLQTVYFDNVALRQTLFTQIREYIQELETIVERLEQVKYDATVDIKTIRLVVENLREIILSLRQICGDARLTMPMTQMKTQLIMYIQKFANEFNKLALGGEYGMKQTKGTVSTTVKDVLMQYLIATRNLQVQLQSFVQFPQRSQITTGFGVQIQTLANSLTAALESVSVENKQVRDVLIVLTRELAQQIEIIVERLQGETLYKTGYGIEMPRVVENLKETLISLRRLAGYEGLTNPQQLKMQLIVCIQDAATEIQRLIWAGQNTLQGQKINGVLSAVLNDFVATLQNQQIQLQNVYQNKQYGQNTQQLAIQIQAITNNLAVFLQNVPSNGQIIDIQVRKLIRIIENVIDRLEVEVSYTKEITGVQRIVENLRQIVASLERVTEMQTSNNGLSFQLHIVLQNVAVELKKLAWIAQSDLEQIQGNLDNVVRSVLIQYLVVLQRVQIELQGINQTVQIGQTPRELALQIQIVANRLSGILRVIVPDNKQTQDSLIWQVRRFYQVIENIVGRLQVQVTKDYGKVDLLQQIIYNLNQIKLSLQQFIGTPYIASTQQLKTQLAIYIQDAAVEIQKLMWVAQSNLQGNTDALIKGVLIDFLAGLQNFQMQIQSNLQIVLGGQNPRSLAIQVQTVAHRLFAYLQWAQLQPNTLQLRQALIIQIGEFTQTIENLVQMLRTEIKNNGENTIAIQQILAKFTKITLSLQKIQGVESKVTVNELCSELIMHVQEVVTEIQRLAWIAQSNLEQTQINFNGVLNGVLNNFLATLRNMLIQLQNTQEFGQYGQSIKELASQIQIVNNKLTTSLENIVAGTKQVKQTLALQILKYARSLQNIVVRLETEVNYDSDMKIDTLRQVSMSLKQIVVGLHQIAESLMTNTTNELKNQLNNYIQNVDAEIQKLLLIQTNFQQYQGVMDTVVRSVLIEYLAAVQNLQIQVQFIHQASQKGLTLPELAIYIQTTVNELTTYLQRIVPTNKLIRQIITTEARQLAKFIASIVNKLQSESAIVVGSNDLLQQVAIQLKESQLSLQRIAKIEIMSDIYQQKIQFVVSVQRAAAILEQLVWTVQPELQLTQVNTGTVSLVREILNDFFTVVQNVDIQIQVALQNGQVGQYYSGLGFRGLQGLQGQYADRYGMAARMGLYGNQDLQGQYADRYGMSKIGQAGMGRLGGLQGYQGLQGLYADRYSMSKNGEANMGLYGYQGLQGQFADKYGMSKIGQANMGLYGRQVYGGKYLGGLEGREMMQTPQQYVNKMEMLARQLSTMLQDTTFNSQQVSQVLSVQARQFVQIVKEIIDQLEGQVTYKTADVTVQQVINRLREVLLSLQRLAAYNTFTIVRELKAQFDNYVQTVVAQIKRLVLIAQEETQGKWHFVLKNVLNTLFNGVQDIYYELKNVAQYRQGYGYDVMNQYGKYDQGYGYGKYDQGYGYGKIDQGYGYGKYDQGYGYGKIDQGYGYGKNDQGYGYGKLNKGYGLFGKSGQYDLQGLNKYGNKYDNEYGRLNDQYAFGLEGKYGMKGQASKQLVNQIRMVANQVLEQLQTVDTTDKQLRQVLFIEARQLIQIVNNMIDRLQIQITIVRGPQYEIVREVVENLTQIERQLQRIVSSGVITTVYQIRAQIANTIETIVAELEKLVVTGQTDVQMMQAVKEVLMQYFVYLRNMYYQHGRDMTSQLELVGDNLSGYIRNTPYNTIQGRELGQGLMDRMQSQRFVGKGQEYLPLSLKYQDSIRGY